ncbi:MAG: hypothetical protein WCO19_01440 [Candidatus Saccharibacteria bacterium]
MPKQNAVKKGYNSNLKSNNITGRKKTLAITMLAFAVVGVVLLIRSFAATVVVTFNPGDNLNATGLTYANAVVVQETTEGKKPTTSNFVELSRPASEYYKASYVRYAAKLNAGYYQGCVSAKPTTKSAGAVLSVIKPSGIGTGHAFLYESMPANYTGVPVAINGLSETCVNFAVTAAEQGKEFTLWFNAQAPYQSTEPTNKWRVNALTIKLNARNETSSNVLLTAGSQAVRDSNNNGIGSGFAQFDDINGLVQVVGVNFKKGIGGEGTLTADTVNTVNQNVLELNFQGTISHNIQIPNSANNANFSTTVPDPNLSSAKTFRYCVLAKPLIAPSNANLTEYAMKQSTSTYSPTVTKVITGTANYATYCIDHVGIKPGEYLEFGFNSKFSDTTINTWRIADSWIEQI